MDGAELVFLLLEIIWWLILGRVLMSWIPMFTQRPLDYGNPIVRFLFNVTEPLLAPIRRFALVGTFDLSPIVLLITIRVVQAVLVG